MYSTTNPLIIHYKTITSLNPLCQSSKILIVFQYYLFNHTPLIYLLLLRQKDV
jgi:hypothetical protein